MNSLPFCLRFVCSVYGQWRQGYKLNYSDLILGKKKKNQFFMKNPTFSLDLFFLFFFFFCLRKLFMLGLHVGFGFHTEPSV